LAGFLIDLCTDTICTQAAGMGSLAQATVCAAVAGLVSFHPAAAQSALLPGWTTQGRAVLSGLILGFGVFIVLGFKGFLNKNILRVATLPSDPGDVEKSTLFGVRR
jgi:hypothetical protein